MYHYSSNSSFWFGNPAARAGAKKKNSLLDEFVIFHTMQGAKVQVNDFDGSMEANMRKHKGKAAVSYRKGWDLPDMWADNRRLGSVAYETQAETSCMWEHRVRAKWVQILHSVDNFAFPSTMGWSMSDVAKDLDVLTTSSVWVPNTDANTPEQHAEPPQTVMHKHNLLKNVAKTQTSRITPLGDPRAYDTSNVHWFTAPRGNNRGESNAAFAVEEMKYYVVHIMSMARKQLDKHQGTVNAAWNALGDKLAQALDHVPADERRRLR